MEDEICIYCDAETVDGDTDGWKQEEFGWKCPECRVVAADEISGGSGSAGMTGIEEALSLDRKLETPPIGVEFSQQVRDASGLGGCVDYEPGYDPATAPPPEQPQPDRMVKLKKEK